MRKVILGTAMLLSVVDAMDILDGYGDIQRAAMPFYNEEERLRVIQEIRRQAAAQGSDLTVDESVVLDAYEMAPVFEKKVRTKKIVIPHDNHYFQLPLAWRAGLIVPPLQERNMYSKWEDAMYWANQNPIPDFIRSFLDRTWGLQQQIEVPLTPEENAAAELKEQRERNRERADS
ncbi:MAG: hypothetical protein LBG04_02670 [Holosporaceae bacterium]|jgi:hypothetical protein|nr:hypothetical protein [Holosporaceae bacterium]